MGGGELEAEYTIRTYIHWNKKAVIVCSLKYINGHSVLVYPKQSLAAVSALLVRPSGTAHPSVDYHEFTRSQT